jgi:hypothetical protein
MGVLLKSQPVVVDLSYIKKLLNPKPVIRNSHRGGTERAEKRFYMKYF